MGGPEAHGNRNRLVACAEASRLYLAANAFRDVQRGAQWGLDKNDDKLLPP